MMTLGQRGQSTLEAAFALPLVMGLIVLVALTMILGGLRLQLTRITENLATCHYGLQPPSACHVRAQNDSRSWLDFGGFSNAVVLTSYQKPFAQMRLRARWGPIKLSWAFKERSPLPDDLFK